MLSTLFTPGRRLFTTSALATLGVAALHTYGASRPIPMVIDAVAQTMQNTALDLGFGMTPSLWDLHQSLAYTMGITLAVMALLGLVLAGTAEATSRVLSRMAAVMTTGCIALTALCWIYRVPPPLISFAILSLLWGVSQRTTRVA